MWVNGRAFATLHATLINTKGIRRSSVHRSHRSVSRISITKRKRWWIDGQRFGSEAREQGAHGVGR